MIVGSLNIRGLGSRVKRSKIKSFINLEKIDFMAIQETKLAGVSASLCCRLWGNADCDWAVLPAVGNSGGILSIWKKSIGSVVFSFTGEGFVGGLFGFGGKFCPVLRYQCLCEMQYCG
jgi:hypothetical protein